MSYKGSQVSYDLRGLCNPNKDYYIEDSVGHFYYAQICGTAAQQCLPSSFATYYQAGSECAGHRLGGEGGAQYGGGYRAQPSSGGWGLRCPTLTKSARWVNSHPPR